MQRFFAFNTLLASILSKYLQMFTIFVVKLCKLMYGGCFFTHQRGCVFHSKLRFFDGVALAHPKSYSDETNGDYHRRHC